MRTVGQYIQSMRHALGKTPAPGHDLYNSFNAAGAQVFNEHPWEFLTTGPVSLAVIANQDYLDLPADFGAYQEVWCPNTGTYTRVEVVDAATIGKMRAATNLSITGGTLYICFTANVPRSGPSLPRALLYPTPETSGAPTMQLMYTRGWSRVEAKDNGRFVTIPEDFEHALDLKARSVCCTLENQMPTVEEAAYAGEVMRLKSGDVRQNFDGLVQGGAGQWMNQTNTGSPVGFADL